MKSTRLVTNSSHFSAPPLFGQDLRLINNFACAMGRPSCWAAIMLGAAGAAVEAFVQPVGGSGGLQLRQVAVAAQPPSAMCLVVLGASCVCKLCDGYC